MWIYALKRKGHSDKPIIAGYFTIGISSVVLDEAEISKKKRKTLQSKMFPRNNSVGCFVIGELCRSDDYTSDELPGEYILNECLSVIKEVQQMIGGRSVLVDSRRALLESLYSKRGFKELMPAGSETEDGDELITSFLKLP